MCDFLFFVTNDDERFERSSFRLCVCKRVSREKEERERERESREQE